ADLAVPIEELEKFLPLLEGDFDIVFASREGHGARRVGEPRWRHILGRGFNFMTQLIIGSSFQDTQCGFKAFRRIAARNLFSQVRLYGDNTKQLKVAAVTAFDVEILFLAVKRGYKVKEVPVKWLYGTRSKVNLFRDTWRNLRDIVRVR